MIALMVAGAGIAAAMAVWLAQGWLRIGMARYRTVFTQAARAQLGDVFLFIDPMQLWVANVLLCVVAGGLVLALSGSPALLAVVLAACLLLPRRGLMYLRRQRLRRFDAQLPDMLLALASGIRAGAGVSSALRLVVAEAPAPLAQEFGLLLRELRLGLTFDAALAHLGQRMPSEATALMVSAMRIAAATGGNLAEALERIAALVRARLHMAGRIDALTAQGRMQAWVVGCLPLLLAWVLHKLEPEAMAQLWETPAGWATVATVVLMECTGLWLIRRIVRIDI